MTAEADRFQLLIARDGLLAAIRREKFYRDKYLEMSRRAVKSRQIDETTNIARGREWADAYHRASLECNRVLRPHRIFLIWLRTIK